MDETLEDSGGGKPNPRGEQRRAFKGGSQASFWCHGEASSGFDHVQEAARDRHRQVVREVRREVRDLRFLREAVHACEGLR